MKLPRPQKTLLGYIQQYRKEHSQRGTRLTHMVGIPMIVASLPTALVNPPLAGGLFAGGWALQFIGHHYFEKNKPSFVNDPYYVLIGPAWVAVEWMEVLGLPIPEAFKEHAEATVAADQSAPAAHVNGDAGAHLNGNAAAAAS